MSIGNIYTGIADGRVIEIDVEQPDSFKTIAHIGQTIKGKLTYKYM